MNNLNKTADEKKWRKIIADWEGSGLTQTQYGRKNNLNSKQISYWHRRFESQKTSSSQKKPKTSPGFTPLDIDDDIPDLSPDIEFMGPPKNSNNIGKDISDGLFNYPKALEKCKVTFRTSYGLTLEIQL